MSTIEKILPLYIRIDGDTQPRAKLSREIYEEYAEQMKAGEPFPAITVYFDGKHYWLADGFHRINAHAIAWPDEPIECEVIKGTKADAQWHSYGANKAHGLRRTPQDKNRAVRSALTHTRGANQSDRQIAEFVGVSHPFVAKVRAKLELSGNVTRCATRTVTRGKSTYEQSTGKTRGKQKKCPNGASSRHMASRVQQPVRVPSPVQKMTALSMPHNPVMGARTLIEIFDADYLRVLVTEISNHLSTIQS
jgi:hypothetical protein